MFLIVVQSNTHFLISPEEFTKFRVLRLIKPTFIARETKLQCCARCLSLFWVFGKNFKSVPQLKKICSIFCDCEKKIRFTNLAPQAKNNKHFKIRRIENKNKNTLKFRELKTKIRTLSSNFRIFKIKIRTLSNSKIWARIWSLRGGFLFLIPL